VRLFPSIDKPDRIYVGFDDRLMAYKLADGQPLWAKPAEIQGWVHDIVQHPAGIIILPESPPANQATGNVRIVNGVVQTGLNVARYADGTTIAEKPLRMRGTVREAIITGGSAVLAVDAESRTFVNVLDVATATVRLQKDVKIKGQLAYAELTPAGLLYVSRSDAATNGEVNVIDLTRGEPKYQDAIEGTKSAPLLHAVDGRTLYVFTSRDHKLYSVDRQDGTYRALSPEIKLQGNEDPTTLEIRPAGIALIASQNFVLLGRDGQIKQQAYYPAPQLPGLLRAPLPHSTPYAPACTAPRRSAYGDAFAQASRTSTDTMAKRITGQIARSLYPGRSTAAGILEPGGGVGVEAFQGVTRHTELGIRADAVRPMGTATCSCRSTRIAPSHGRASIWGKSASRSMRSTILRECCFCGRRRERSPDIDCNRMISPSRCHR